MTTVIRLATRALLPAAVALALWTTPAAAGVDSIAAVVPPEAVDTTAGLADAPEDGAPGIPLAARLATDRGCLETGGTPLYRLGDPIQVAFRVEGTCCAVVTLEDRMPDGQNRTLVPPFRPGGQTWVLAGRIAPPVGVETLVLTAAAGGTAVSTRCSFPVAVAGPGTPPAAPPGDTIVVEEVDIHGGEDVEVLEGETVVVPVEVTLAFPDGYSGPIEVRLVDGDGLADDGVGREAWEHVTAAPGDRLVFTLEVPLTNNGGTLTGDPKQGGESLGESEVELAVEVGSASGNHFDSSRGDYVLARAVSVGADALVDVVADVASVLADNLEPTERLSQVLGIVDRVETLFALADAQTPCSLLEALREVIRPQGPTSTRLAMAQFAGKLAAAAGFDEAFATKLIHDYGIDQRWAIRVSAQAKAGAYRDLDQAIQEVLEECRRR